MHQHALADSRVLLPRNNGGTSGAWKGEDEFVKPGIRLVSRAGGVCCFFTRQRSVSAEGDLYTGGTSLVGVNLMAFSGI